MNVQLTDKIELIFKSTLELVHEKGFHGTPMSQIAKRSDVAIGTIYHYFPSKDQLIIALYCYSKRKINSFIFEDWDHSKDYKSQFYMVVSRLYRFYKNNVAIFSFLEQFHNSPYLEMANSVLERHLNEENSIINIFQKGMIVGKLRNINIHILISSCFGVVGAFTRTVINGTVTDNEENIQVVTDIIWNGLKQND